jgi:hypothetical protein
MPGNLLAKMAQRKNPDGPSRGYGVDDLYQFLSSYTLPRDPGSEFEYSNTGRRAARAPARVPRGDGL